MSAQQTPKPWPTHPDGRPMKLGEMTREQRLERISAAMRRVATKMQANAPAISKVLADFDAGQAAPAGEGLPPQKGEYNGPCNRSACLEPGAQYFNHANRLHYCRACAHMLNTDPFTVRDAERWWGPGMRFCEYRPTPEPLPERRWL